MRISFQYQSLLYQKALQTSLGGYLSASAAVEKGRNLVSPEQSPSAYISAMNLQRSIDDMEQFVKNAENAISWYEQTETQINSILESISEIRNDTAINGANGVHSKESARALAGTVLEAYNKIFGLANTPYMGSYLFAGYETNTQPFKNEPSYISYLTQTRGTSGDISTRQSYGDLQELASGEYSVNVVFKDDVGYLTVTDKYGKNVMLDSNGIDDTLNVGNDIGTTLTFKAEPNGIINTGRGLTIKLPDTIVSGDSASYTFRYNAGSTSATYMGDNGKINSLIGLNQHVPINVTGQELFLRNHKIIMGSQINTISGMPLTPSSLFSGFDKANSAMGDSITISGADHLGRQVGSASVLGTERSQLKLLDASKEERTLTLAYAGKYYQIEVPAKGYKTIDELTHAINNELKNARYVGAEDPTASYPNLDVMSSSQNTDIKAGFPDHTGNPNFTVDLSEELKVVADGDRLSFSTATVGDHVTLSVTGAENNVLGFDDKTVVAAGRDTTFEIGDSFDRDGMDNLYTTHAGLDLDSGADAIFTVNGKRIIVKGLNTATSIEEKEAMIDKVLQKEFGFTVTASLADGGGGLYDMTLSMRNVNYDRTTNLATSVYDPVTHTYGDYQMVKLEPGHAGTSRERTVGDFMSFVETLYNNSVSVSLVDGKLAVQDLRGGDSKLSMVIKENNEGISLPHPNDYNSVYGSYTGSLDQTWGVTSTTTRNPDGSRSVAVQIADTKGNIIFDKVLNNYRGEEITLLNGVKFVAGDHNMVMTNPVVDHFTLDLKGRSGLNFGDMNVYQASEKEDMFASLMNLYDALYNGSNLDGSNAPTLWRDEESKSTAVPYFDGIFGGNFNAEWSYNIVPVDGKTEYYIQDEFTVNSGKVHLFKDPALMGPGAQMLDFEIQYYDNVTNSLKKQSISIDLDGISTDDELAKAIETAVNTDNALYEEGITARVEDGEIVFSSGSGTKNISLAPSNDAAMYMMGLRSGETALMADSSTEGASFDYKVYDSVTTSWITVPITVSPWTDPADAVAEINAQLEVPPATGTYYASAAIVDGKLEINPMGAYSGFYDNLVSPDGGLGIANQTVDYNIGAERVHMDMREATEAQRTLTFKYIESGVEKTASITMDALEYQDINELVKAVNEKLNDEGLGAFSAVAIGDKLAFSGDGTIEQFSIEGDYEGWMGFAKTGDKVEVKVTDERGRNIQNLTVDTANKLMDVSDGVLLGFDAGTLIAAENFSCSVGSGIDYEIGVLDNVENQLLQMLTTIGNRHNRADAVIGFHAALTLANEDRKAVYLGGTEMDKVNAITNQELALSAYQYALSMTTKMMSISILDFLR